MLMLRMLWTFFFFSFVVSGDGSRAGEQVRLQAGQGHENFPEDAVAAVEGGRGDRRRGSCVQVNGTPFEIDSFFCVQYRFEPKGTYIIAHAAKTKMTFFRRLI